MRRIFAFFIIFLWTTTLIAQKNNIAPFKYFNYGQLLLNVKDNSLNQILDKNYFSVVLGDSIIFLSDSSAIYLRNRDFSPLAQIPVLSQSADILQLVYLKSGAAEAVYAIGVNIFDTIKVYKLIGQNLTDSLILGKYNGKKDIVYVDSTKFTLALANVDNLTGAVKYTFRFLDFSINGITDDTTIVYENPQSNFFYPVQSLKLSHSRDLIALVSSANTYIFHLNQFMDVLSIEQYPIYGDRVSLVKDNFLFLANNRKLYRLDISKENYGYISFADVIKSMSYLPNASLLLSFFSTADTSFITLLNPDADSVNGMFPQYCDYSFAPQTGGRLNYNFTSPWFDFQWQADTAEGGHYFFVLDSNFSYFEPDTIHWYVDGHFAGTTVKGNNFLSYRFFRQGDYKITAQGIYSADRVSVEVNHILTNPYDAFPNVIEEDTLFFCYRPDTVIDITKYTTGRDSIVWFRNKKSYPPLFNQDLAQISLPGEYYLYIYLPDTVLSDTVVIYYLDKEFSDNQVQLYVNEEPYDSLNNIYCTNDGLVYFEVKFPHNPRCANSYVAYWNFGDGYTARLFKAYVDHKYYNPGKYIVMLTLRNTRSGASYDFIFPIQVSINPVKKYPRQINLQKLSTKKIYLGRDIIVEKQKIKENNIFYTYYGQQIFDSAEIVLPITDEHYQSATNQNITFFAFLAGDDAEGTEIKLYNQHNQEATIMPNQISDFPDTRFFYGHPKIDIPNYPHKNESFYHYFWNDASSLTFFYMTQSNPTTVGVFDVFDDYLEELEWFDLAHYQVYPTTLHPYSSLNALALDSMGNQWKVKFIVHPKDTGVNHITVHSVGLILPSYRSNNSYSYKWNANLDYSVVNDTILEISSVMEGKYYFSLQVSDNFGCKYNTYTDVYVLDTLASILPNTFTPNGDGINDVWDLRSAFYNEIFVEHVPILVKIWDKNGRIITTFIANQTYWWDGRDTQGRKVPPGTYWYLITLANKIHIKGFISVIY